VLDESQISAAKAVFHNKLSIITVML